MAVAIDTNVLVKAHVSGDSGHERCLDAVSLALAEGGVFISTIVMSEFLHTVVDPKRVIDPPSMKRAIAICDDYLNAANINVCGVEPLDVHGAMQLMSKHSLGRKRVNDTI